MVTWLSVKNRRYPGDECTMNDAPETSSFKNNGPPPLAEVSGNGNWTFKLSLVGSIQQEAVPSGVQKLEIEM